MTPWLEQSGYPVIDKAGHQKRFLLDETSKDSSAWPVRNMSDDMSGHYLIALTDEEFMAELKDFDSKTLEQKLRLLIDRSLLAKTPAVASSSLIPILERLRDEQSLAVWEIAATMISDLKIFFSDDAPLRRWVDGLISDQFERLGVSGGGDDEEKKLRALIVSLAVYGEDAKKLVQVSELTEVGLRNMDADMRSTALIASVKCDQDGKKLYNYTEELESETDPEIRGDLLSAVGAGRDKKIIELLSNTKAVKPQDHVYLYMYLRRNKITKSDAFAWLRDNWEYTRRIGGDKSLEYYPKITANTVRIQSEFEEYDNFFGKMGDDLAIARTIAVGREEISTRLSLIESDGEGVRKGVEK
jgi:aminopeptidase N